MGTILTPEEYATDIAYTIKRKHKCSVLLLKFGEFKCKDNIAMLFLLTLSLSKATAKIRHFFHSAKFILPDLRKVVSLQIENIHYYA